MAGSSPATSRRLCVWVYVRVCVFERVAGSSPATSRRLCVCVCGCMCVFACLSEWLGRRRRRPGERSNPGPHPGLTGGQIGRILVKPVKLPVKLVKLPVKPGFDPWSNQGSESHTPVHKTFRKRLLLIKSALHEKSVLYIYIYIYIYILN